MEISKYTKNKYSLTKAREYERENKVSMDEKPLFHITPPVGWMNDPNGFSVYDGKIHLFYQYHPYSTEWGPMHWGHVVTEDLMCWEQLPVAMAPDIEYDGEGCFSGTAICKDGRHVLVYTSVEKNPDGDGVLQNQSIAVFDGTEYRKIDSNPVVTGDMLPGDLSRSDFRDPKVWLSDGMYYMVAGCVDKEDKGLVVLFTSTDMQTWKYKSILARNDGDLGGVWECPDFFELDDRYVLMVSPTGMKASGYEFHNGNNSIYFVGGYDKDNGKFIGEKAYSLDYGTDFYAPQTTLLPDGRRVMIAWMQSWHNLYIPDGQRWQGMMTLPREISLENGSLMQRPVREIEKYHANEIRYFDEIISGQCKLDGICGRTIDMTLIVKGNEYESFAVDFAKGDGYYTRFTYDRRRKVIELDRTFAGFKKDIVCVRRAKVKTVDPTDTAANVSGVCGVEERISLRFVLDRNSIELFVNDGIMTMSTVIYTPLEDDGIEFICDGKATVDVDLYDIEQCISK